MSEIAKAAQELATVGGSPTVGAQDLELLTAEIERYLAAVDVFRRESSEPHWRAEEQLPGGLPPVMSFGDAAEPPV